MLSTLGSRRPLVRASALIVAAIMPVAASHAQQTGAPAAPKTAIAVEVVAKGLDNPWGMQFLPDGRMLVTERPGTMRLVSKDGKLSDPIKGVPKVVDGGQAGLLDVLLATDFETSSIIYLSYSEPRDDGRNGTSVMRAKLTLADVGGALSDTNVIFRQEPAFAGQHHFGSRLVWGKDGTLFITTGDRFSERDSAQDLGTHLGKVIRINADGSVPKDNPFVGRENARPEIWSYGHRNIQGAALDPDTGLLWTTEHGAQGGDELNATMPGKNYGWPIISWGINYDDTKIGEGLTAKGGLEQPVYYWNPSIATSGLVFYTGDLFKDWKGNILTGGLAGTVVERLVLKDGKVVAMEALLGDRGDRIRDVRQGLDGAIYVLTDHSDGKLLRIVPKS
jgi:aldose sugar dehydrogenase